MIAADFEAESRAVPLTDDRARYREEQQRIRAAFAEALAAEHLPYMPDPVTDAVFRRAWEEGHSSGFHAVETAYADLVSLVEIVEATR